ncbi:MAG: sigma-54 dependent transcriptional regulator [Planctomycetota bacterium]|nr:sigma-54 dependent transcriptional regulator [Planctomycetota bacterium]
MTVSKASDSETSPAAAIRTLIVDNDRAHAHTMAEILVRIGFPCDVATSGPEGLRQVQQNTYEIVITDLVMNEVDGMQLLARAKEVLPESQVIMVTGHASVPKAVEAMQHGAFNFLEKPISADRLRVVFEHAVDEVRLRQQNRELTQQNLELTQRLDDRFGFEGIIYTSDKMKSVIDRIKRIAPTDATVLITGESGTGKELIAQAIHQNSPSRKNKRMVPLNARAVAENLVESELFGHVKGAFTDAVTDRVGAFEYANGGTLFLDEVGDMPMSTQVKLLRVVEEHQVTRVGDNKPIPVNVRLVSATNRSLEDAVESGEFRRDLYYRIKVITIELPSLRERREDILPLVDHFRKLFAKRHNKSVKNISPAVSRRLFAYDWPGNVRHLRNAVETMVVLDMDGLLDVDDLPSELAAVDERQVAVLEGPMSLVGKPFTEYERWAIEQTLKLTNGNREETANILGIGARTLYRKLEKFNL